MTNHRKFEQIFHRLSEVDTFFYNNDRKHKSVIQFGTICLILLFCSIVLFIVMRNAFLPLINEDLLLSILINLFKSIYYCTVDTVDIQFFGLVPLLQQHFLQVNLSLRRILSDLCGHLPNCDAIHGMSQSNSRCYCKISGSSNIRK